MEAAAAARESIDQQIGLFEELTAESEYSAQSIIDNWNAQRKAFANYESNLQKATELGLDKTLVKQLSDGSVESMQILDALVNNTGIRIDDINLAFEGLNESKDSVSKVMSDIQTNYNDRLDEMVDKAEDSGYYIVDGLVKAINDKVPAYESAMTKLGKKGQTSFDRVNLIKSPSRWAKGRGEFIVDGGIIGIEGRMKAFENTMAELANAGQAAFIDRQAAFIADYPNQMAVPVANSRSIAHNYGGFNINITQLPGESADDLAHRVMEVMQMEVDAKGAVFHG